MSAPDVEEEEGGGDEAPARRAIWPTRCQFSRAGDMVVSPFSWVWASDGAASLGGDGSVSFLYSASLIVFKIDLVSS